MSAVECSAHRRRIGRGQLGSTGSLPGETPAPIFGTAPNQPPNVYWVSRENGRCIRSALGKRPNPHALPPAIPAMVYLGIPADAELIKAVMRGILTAICAKSAEPLRVLDRRNLPAPSEVGLYPPLFTRHNHALPAAATTATLGRRAKAKPIDDASERKRQSGTSDHRVLLSDTNIAASSMPPECVG